MGAVLRRSAAPTVQLQSEYSYDNTVILQEACRKSVEAVAARYGLDPRLSSLQEITFELTRTSVCFSLFQFKGIYMYVIRAARKESLRVTLYRVQMISIISHPVITLYA